MYIQKFQTLASFWIWAGQFESYLVGNPADKFSHDVAQMVMASPRGLSAEHWLWMYVISNPSCNIINEPWHDKTNKMSVCLAKTQISLGTRPVRSESSLCAQWVAKDPSFLHLDSEDSYQTGRMPRLIWVFAGRTLIWLVLSCCGSNGLAWGSGACRGELEFIIFTFR